MNTAVSQIYDLLGTDPQAAHDLALQLASITISPSEKDEINWARAYALIDLQRFSEAKQIWQGIFDRTHDHRALHQVGFAERSSGDLWSAFNGFLAENALIPESNKAALAANFYELSYCSYLMKRSAEAHQFFKAYEMLDLGESDLIERGCFYRLKGDLLADEDPVGAKIAYQKSLIYFQAAQDYVAGTEIQTRMANLQKSL